MFVRPPPTTKKKAGLSSGRSRHDAGGLQEGMIGNLFTGEAVNDATDHQMMRPPLAPGNPTSRMVDMRLQHAA
mgnify:FL=1